MEDVEFWIQISKLVGGTVGLILIFWALVWLQRIHNLLVGIHNKLTDLIEETNKKQ